MRAVRLLAFAALVGGCTVVEPGGQLTQVIVPANPQAAVSLRPWPSDPPASPSPSPTPLAAMSFSGNGPRGRVGPIPLKFGHAVVRVRFQSTIANDGGFMLELHDDLDHFLNVWVNESGGSFDLSPGWANLVVG